MISGLDRRNLGKVGVPKVETIKIDSKFQDLIQCQILADKDADDGKLEHTMFDHRPVHFKDFFALRRPHPPQGPIHRETDRPRSLLR